MRTPFFLASAVVATGLAVRTAPLRAAVPTTLPAAQAAASDTSTVRLRALQPVLDARERRQDWHQAADAAVQRVESAPLRKELTQRLAGLVPHIAKALTDQPHDDALATVAVYREPGLEGKQAMVAVTFDGMGSNIEPETFANILSDLPKAPQAEGVSDKLVLDPQATSYMVFFLDRDGLKASNVPHDKMKQSVMLAINRQHEEAAKSQVAAQRQADTAAQARAQQQSTDLSAAQQATASEAPSGPYTAGPSYPYVIPEVLNDGYVYPGVGVPIVILPSGTVAQPNNQANGQQPNGTQNPNQQRRTFPGPGQPGGPPAAGVNQPAGSSGVNQPAGSAGVRQPAGSAGVNQPAGQAGQQTPSSSQRPSPPPPQREAPPAQRGSSGTGQRGGQTPAQK